jgi:hypothetical protein
VAKRIVLQETQGPRAGLHHIMGTNDEFVDGTELPTFVDGVDIMGRLSAASMVAINPRYVLYREVLADGSSEPTEENPGA